MKLPDFLQLSPAAVKEERKRQERLKREFNSRVRQTPVEMELARALIIEQDLRYALKGTKGGERFIGANQLAENLAQQGRFIEASQVAKDKDLQQFFSDASEAIFNGQECGCSPKIRRIGQNRVQMPKFRVIKEVYSIKEQSFGYLVECNSCKKWSFSAQNPLPQVKLGNFDLKKTPNDLERLKI